MSKKKSAAMAAFTTRLDGWKNVLTGLGIKGKDKRKSSQVSWCQMTEVEADELFSGSDTARKIVSEVVADALSKGYDFKAEEEIAPELQSKLIEEGERLQVDAKIQEAWLTARQHGGAVILLIPNDLTKMNTPFVPEAVGEIKSLLVLSRWELAHDQVENDIRSSNYGLPRTYRINPKSARGANANETVHYSRLIRFDGDWLPKQNFIKNNYWHDSVLNKAQEPIRDYDNAVSAVSAALDDYSVGVMKIKNLQQMIAEDKDDLVVRRMEIANLGKSVSKTVILDAESEEFTYQDRQLTGVADCVRLISGRLVVVSKMPHTKILGESPQGSNATGNSTTKDYYDYVKSEQENYLDPRLRLLWKWILLAKKSPTGGKVPAGFELVYAPLWQEPESVQADVRLKTSQADEIDIRNGVLDPNEVAVSRWGSGEYSRRTQLMAERKEPTQDPKEAKAEADAEAAKAQADALKKAGGAPGAKKPPFGGKGT
jgi:phage-related protein (TIGR01555 family)